MGFLVVAFSFGRGARLIQVMGKSSKLASIGEFGKYQPMDFESLFEQS